MSKGHACLAYYAGLSELGFISKDELKTFEKNNSNLLAKAKAINEKLMPLHKALFIESSPSPVKFGASLLNLCSDEVRLPLVKITDETKKAVKSAMKHANLL